MLETVVKKHKGVPTIMVEGKPLPPMTFCSRHYTNPTYIRRLHEAGVRVFFIFTHTEWLRPGAWEQLKKDAQLIVDNAPEAMIFVRVNIDAPEDWEKAHPEEGIKFQTGQNHGQYSFSSKLWQKKTGEALEALIDRVEGSFIGRRCLGYFFNAGGTEEFYVPKTYNYLDLCVGFDEPFKPYYRDWLKRRYGTDAALRKAWNRPDASIDTPLIPPMEDRILAHTDREHNAERVEHNLDFGAILDPDRHQHVADFYQAWNDATADAFIHLAGRVKKKTGGKQLVGAFYGAMGCVMYHEWATSSYVKVMNSGVVDFLSAPSNYENRFPPGSSAFTNPIGSLRAHNMVWFNEEDDRTHLAGGEFSQKLDTETSVAIMKRNAARTLTEDTQSWWFENSQLHEWWDSPEIMRVLGRFQDLARYQWSRPRKKLSQICFVYSQESIWHCDQETLKDMFQFNKMFELGRIGAPADHIMLDDLADKQFQDYRVYVFMNTVCMSDTQRKLVDKVVKRDGKAAVWVHASGLINPDATRRLDLAHASALGGINLRAYPMSLAGTYYMLREAHPIVFPLPAGRLGQYDQSVDCLEAYSNPEGTPFVATRVNPTIVADDAQATALAKFSYFVNPRSPNGTAVALKKFDDWTSVFYGSKCLDSQVLRSIANYIGVHIYNWADDLFYANDDFVGIHAYSAGEKHIHLPRPADVVDAFEGQEIGRGVKDFRIEMPAGESRLFSLNGRV